MKISIQLATKTFTVWDDIIPVLHAVKDWDEAVTIAYAISRQNGNYTVRLVQIPDYISLRLQITTITRKLIGNISGCYIQSV